MSKDLTCCLLGMAGNVAVELVTLLRYAQQGRYHRKYTDWRFWTARVLLVFTSGVMALAFSLSGFGYPILAFHAGVAATLLIERMSSKPPYFPDTGGRFEGEEKPPGR